jgi:hypothetical protein
MKRTLVGVLLSLIVLGNFSWGEAQVSSTPDYAKVFPQNRLNKITISISKADWDSIKIDMKEKFKTDFGKSPFPRMGYPMVNVLISRVFHRCHKMANDQKDFHHSVEVMAK